MIRWTITLSALGMALFSTAASARDIVLTNDDGLTSNVVAVYKALKAAGHDVVVSVPCTNQSGMSGAVRFSRPIAPLAADCLNGAAKAGAPGAGAMTREGLGADFSYVDGTPVMAMLYGVDVVAAKRWGHAPDLVLSGPNEGQNLGGLTVTSGTVGAAQAASLRGMPAIALSAGGATAGTADRPLDNPASVPVAREVVRLVATLGGGENKPMLPAGLVLNVNFPDRLEGARWRVTQVGTRTGLTWRFAQSMAREQTPKMKQIAAARGMTVPDLPGIVLSDNEAVPTAEQANDEAVVNARDITVSPLQAGYGITGSNAWLNKALAPLSGR